MSYSILNSFSDPIVTRRVFETISVAPGSLNVLRTAIGTVDATWTTKNNPTVIQLGVGTYNEIQIYPVNGLEIHGAGIDSTIIVTDGLREDVDPVSGIAYNLMDLGDKTGIFGHYDLKIKSLTWRANDVKYCIHADSGLNAVLSMSAELVKFQHSNFYPIGIGARGSQNYSFSSCQFAKLGDNAALAAVGSHGVLWHNDNAETSSATLNITNCTFENCGVLTLSELESGQTDPVTVTNCTTDDDGTAKGIYISAANSGLAYNINITQNGGTMPDFAFDAVNRPDAASYYTLNT